MLQELVGGKGAVLTPTLAYDPVARVVTVTPIPEQPFEVGQTYRLTILAPSGPSDPNGLRAIDGATLSSPSTLTFEVGPPRAQRAPPTIDFCRDVLPMLTSKCALSGCHGQPSAGPLAADGLRLDSAEDVRDTAIGRVAVESNTGPLLGATAPAGLALAEDVPLVDPGPASTEVMVPSAAPDDGGLDAEAAPAIVGDPMHSWVMLKLLMAAPPACSSTPGAVPCEAGVPAEATASPSVRGLYGVACDDAGSPCPSALPEDERARLAALIVGREMPYGPDGAPGPDAVDPAAMTVDELELVSVWIGQGARTPTTCAP